MDKILIPRSSFGNVVPICQRPSWPGGFEPDLICGIVGGFIDGYGFCHALPVSLRGYRYIYAAKDETGWYFGANPVKPLELTPAPL